MPEAEKRMLDALRIQPNHPATTNEDLPEAAKSYINELEVNVYGLHQQLILLRTVGQMGIGAFFLYASFYDIKPADDLFTRLITIALLVIPVIWAIRDWKRNSDRLLPEEGSWNSTDEQLRYHWELDYISKQHIRAEYAEENLS